MTLFPISDHVSFPREYDSLFEVYAYIHVSSHTQLLNNEIILKEMTCYLKWENIVMQQIVWK